MFERFPLPSVAAAVVVVVASSVSLQEPSDPVLAWADTSFVAAVVFPDATRIRRASNVKNDYHCIPLRNSGV